jgi:bifunctional pyridoxal-dependent enzyme with beta-cystathionase and maltose regulon repressor activities
MKLKLNVYPAIADMEIRLAQIMDEAVAGRAKMVEIAYGEAGEDVKKRILNFLNRKDIRALYSRLEKTDKGSWGRVYVYFRWKD